MNRPVWVPVFWQEPVRIFNSIEEAAHRFVSFREKVYEPIQSMWVFMKNSTGSSGNCM